MLTTALLNEKESNELLHKPAIKAPRKTILFDSLPLSLRLILAVPAEDGLYLVPLCYTGINPFTACISAALFAVAHYPNYNILVCIPKGIFCFCVALFILPYGGIVPIIAGHLLIDFVTGFAMKAMGMPYRIYHSNGALKEEGIQKSGKRSGKIITYYASGKMCENFFCIKGKAIGNYKRFYESGNLELEGLCEEGKLNGVVRHYNEDGSRKPDVFYKNGRAQEPLEAESQS